MTLPDKLETFQESLASDAPVTRKLIMHMMNPVPSMAVDMFAVLPGKWFAMKQRGPSGEIQQLQVV